MDCGTIPWGDANAVFTILDKEIRENTNVGVMYGNGVKNIGIKLNARRIPEVKGQGISAYDPRVFKGMGVTYATSPMGADHTSGAAIAGRVASQNKDYGELTDNKGKFDLSFELQVYTTVLDSMGCCYFIGPSFENMNIITAAINAMYNLELSREDVIDIGKQILKVELDFNEKAGIPRERNELPQFLREETSEPSGLKFTFKKEELTDFWSRLDST
jgi:aldehyde:ferredoxin oxidoreductase